MVHFEVLLLLVRETPGCCHRVELVELRYIHHQVLNGTFLQIRKAKLPILSSAVRLRCLSGNAFRARFSINSYIKITFIEYGRNWGSQVSQSGTSTDAFSQFSITPHAIFATRTVTMHTDRLCITHAASHLVYYRHLLTEFRNRSLPSFCSCFASALQVDGFELECGTARRILGKVSPEFTVCFNYLWQQKLVLHFTPRVICV